MKKLGSPVMETSAIYSIYCTVVFYIYFDLLENDEFTKHSFQAPMKAMRPHSLPAFQHQQFKNFRGSSFSSLERTKN